jgi:hypothetical protein
LLIHYVKLIGNFQDGLVEVSPALSRTSDESPNVFLSDSAVQIALRRGFNLAPQIINDVACGSDFEYIIFNVRDILVPHRREELLRRERVLESLRSVETRSAIQWRQNLNLESQLDGALDTNTHISLCAEIVNGAGFDGRTVFVSYCLSLPLSASFCHQTLGGSKVQLVTGRTHGSVPRQFPNNNLRSSLNQISRVVLSVFLFLSSVLGVVVLGSNSAFWILCALTLLFTVARGLPNNTQLFHYIHNNTGCRKSIISVIGDDSHSLVFNHLFNASLNLRTDDLRDRANLNLTVYSRGMFDELRVEGYASMSMLLTANNFDEKLNVLRPKERGRDEVRRLFLGGGARLRDSTQSSRPFAVRSLNAFGVLSETTGWLQVRGQLLASSSKWVISARSDVSANSQVEISDHKSSFQRLEQPTVAKKTQRSVTDILQAFRAKQTGDRRGALGVSISTELSQLGSTSALKPSRKQQVLQRIRQARENTALKRLSSVSESKTKLDMESDDELSVLLQPSVEIDNDSAVQGRSAFSESMGLNTRRGVLDTARRLVGRYETTTDVPFSSEIGKDSDENEVQQPLLS